MATWTIVNESTDHKGFQFQTTLFEGFKIEQLRSPRAASDADFLPVQVVFNDKVVWSFPEEYKKTGFPGMAFLREVGDELVIICSTKHLLCEVIPVRDLSHRQRIGNEFVGGRKFKELVELKELVATAEGLEPAWTPREITFRDALRKSIAETRQAAKASVDAVLVQQREERRARRDAKRTEISNRKRIFAHTLQGERRHGCPVVGDEWTTLGDGAFCVSVTSYNSKTGEVGELLESFMVKNDGSKKIRHAVSTVSGSTSIPRATKMNLESSSFVFVTVPVKGNLEEVIRAKTMDDIRSLRDQGLNSGTLAMCPKAGGERGRFSVFSITAGKIEPVTEVVQK